MLLQGQFGLFKLTIFYGMKLPTCRSSNYLSVATDRASFWLRMWKLCPFPEGFGIFFYFKGILVISYCIIWRVSKQNHVDNWISFASVPTTPHFDSVWGSYSRFRATRQNWFKVEKWAASSPRQIPKVRSTGPKTEVDRSHQIWTKIDLFWVFWLGFVGGLFWGINRMFGAFLRRYISF